MKRPSSGKRSRKKTAPTPDEIKRHIDNMVDSYQFAWHDALVVLPEPNWTRLLCLHLQMVELEHLDAGMKELF